MGKWVKILLIIVFIVSIILNIVFISYNLYSKYSEKKDSNLIYQFSICLSECPFEKVQNSSYLMPSQNCLNKCSSNPSLEKTLNKYNRGCSFSSSGKADCNPYILSQRIADCWANLKSHQNETIFKKCLNPIPLI